MHLLKLVLTSNAVQMLQSLDNVPEIKYILGYMSKTTGFTDPEDYKFEADKQFIFEGILDGHKKYLTSHTINSSEISYYY